MITKEEFDLLYSPGILQKDYKDIISRIDDRFSEIMILLLGKIKGWYDYDNVTDHTDGFFNIDNYRENIGIYHTGDYDKYKPDFIPTRWLWTSNEDILKEYKKNIEEEKQRKLAEKLKDKQKREKLKQDKIKFKQIIQSKLTKEELKYIKFK